MDDIFFQSKGAGSLQGRTVALTLRINYTAIFLVVLFMHALIIFKEMKEFKNPISFADQGIRPLKIQAIDNLRQAGSKESKSKMFSDIRRKAPVLNNKINEVPKEISLSDLAMNSPQKVQRPGTRPEVLPERTRPINAISLKGKEIMEFARASNAAALSGDPRALALSQSDILVNLEVPEGVELDELNKYELMFYGFQRRTAMNYINAFYKNLDKFQRENPHLKFPMTESKQVMTGRMTFDDEGNVKQIKMIRWTNVDRLQGFFESVLKEMDTLHNPPQALWEKTGEFSIFFSFVVNG